MTRDEKIWSSIKFTLLLCFSVALLYILLCKYVTPIPESITGNAVTEINDAEAILEDQKQMSEKLITLKIYCMRAFKTIQDYFDIKQKLYWTTKNTEDRKKILEEMKTKIR